jgi:hypothetical protein
MSGKKGRNYKRLVLGDVIEIPLSTGRFAYAQYTYNYVKPPGWGKLFRVLPGIFKSRPEDLPELVRQGERFYAFCPLAPAVTQGWVTIVCNEKIPKQCRGLPVFKACNRNFATGKKTWFIWDGKRAAVKVGSLSPEHYDLPLKQVISYGLLLERIESGWSPRDEV